MSQALLAWCHPAVYEEFLKPLLLVALFAPPEELSAGVVLGAFYFYTLAHQSDFDVCWCKVGALGVCVAIPYDLHKLLAGTTTFCARLRALMICLAAFM